MLKKSSQLETETPQKKKSASKKIPIIIGVLIATSVLSVGCVTNNNNSKEVGYEEEINNDYKEVEYEEEKLEDIFTFKSDVDINMAHTEYSYNDIDWSTQFRNLGDVSLEEIEEYCDDTLSIVKDLEYNPTEVIKKAILLSDIYHNVSVNTMRKLYKKCLDIGTEYINDNNIEKETLLEISFYGMLTQLTAENFRDEEGFSKYPYVGITCDNLVNLISNELEFRVITIDGKHYNEEYHGWYKEKYNKWLNEFYESLNNAEKEI